MGREIPIRVLLLNSVSNILKFLGDDFIKENLIISLMRVFIDAERLGTANQFYEKFSIRNKIFYLILKIYYI